MANVDEVLETLTPTARRQVGAALQDPDTREETLALLRSRNPHDALLAQAEQDLMESLKDVPERKIVFKDMARSQASALMSAIQAIREALPESGTEEGERAKKFLKANPRDRRAIENYYMRIALRGVESSVPLDPGLAGIDWRVLAVGLAPAVIGMVAPVLPDSIGNVLKDVGSSLSQNMSKIFAAATPAPKVTTPPAAPAPQTPVTTPGAAAPIVPVPPGPSTGTSMSSMIPWAIAGVGLLLVFGFVMRR